MNALKVFALAAAVAALPFTASAQTRTLTRSADPVVLQGEVLLKVWNRKISSLRVLSKKSGRLEAIPFQIDKLDPDGVYIIPTASMTKAVIDETNWDTRSEEERHKDRLEEFKDDEQDLLRDVKSGKLKQAEFEKKKRRAEWIEKSDEFDYNDEIAFMVHDAGDRAASAEYPAGADTVEVTVKNPLDGTVAWVYVAAFQTAPPPLSPVDYLTYNAKTDTVESRFAVMDFVDNKPLILEKIVPKNQKEGGKLLPNVLDRFKLRITIKPIMFFALNFDENNVKSFTVGYVDGPVRVIRRNVFWIIIGGIKLPFFPKAIVYFKFYENQLQGPTEVFNPFNPKYTLREGSMFTGGVDLRKTVYGSKVSTAGLEKPFVIDGKMTPEETAAAAANSRNRPWFVVYKEEDETGIIARFIMDDELVKKGTTMDFRFVDDGDRDDPPENERGFHYVGYDVDLLTFPKGKYNVAFYQYLAYPYKPGDEKQYLDIYDNPLVYSSK